MIAFMRRFDASMYALVRAVSGFLFLWHGSQKLLSYPSSAPEAPPFVITVAGTIELVGGTLIMLGLATRWAAFISSGLMAAAYWMAHGTKATLPIENGGELAVLYCFLFLFLSAHGSGNWSVDALRGAK